ncbi:MAG: hypothetical protein AAGG08_08155, partial [Actinomycetota bacterium]
VLVSRRLEPRDAAKLHLPDEPVIVFADWLSPRTRELLRNRRASYIDGTGNIDVRLDRPVVTIRTDGASRDPDPKPRTQGPSLDGPRAWALMRTLVEVEPPNTAGELAASLDMDDGYVSRILKVLAEELTIEREPRQPVTGVDWERIVRQIADDYRLLKSNETAAWTAMGGPEQFLRDLAAKPPRRYALTGSFSSIETVIVAPSTTAVVYTDDPERLANDCRLRPTRTGGNVVTAVPYDSIVYERTRTIDGLRHASIAQVAIDCLTGFQRMPSEGEALLEWMKQNEPKWRAGALLDS